jgi:hypothetical protein
MREQSVAGAHLAQRVGRGRRGGVGGDGGDAPAGSRTSFQLPSCTERWWTRRRGAPLSRSAGPPLVQSRMWWNWHQRTGTKQPGNTQVGWRMDRASSLLRVMRRARSPRSRPPTCLRLGLASPDGGGLAQGPSTALQAGGHPHQGAAAEVGGDRRVQKVEIPLDGSI